MKQIKGMNKVVIINVLSTVITSGISTITAPVISRMLGASNYGIVSIYNTWVTVIGVIFGLQAVGTFAMARVEYDEESQESYQSSCLGLTIVSYILCSTLMIFVILFFRIKLNLGIGVVFIAIIQAFGVQCGSMINTKFVYEFKAQNNMILSIVTVSSILLLSIVLIKVFPPEINYWGRIVAMASFYSIEAFVVSIYLFNRGKTFYNPTYWRFCVSLSVPIIAHNLASIILSHFDVLMLQRLIDNRIVGIYSFAGTFAGILNIIVTALDKSWIPFYFEYLKNNNSNEIKTHARNYLILFLVLCFGFMLLSNDVFHIFASEEYWEGINLIPLLVMGYFFSFLYRFPTNYEFYRKKTRLVAIGTIMAGIINIILNYFFIIMFSATGAAIATGIANVFLWLFHQFFARKIINDNNYPLSISFFIPFVIAFLAFLFVYKYIFDKRIICWSVAFGLGAYELLRMYKTKSII